VEGIRVEPRQVKVYVVVEEDVEARMMSVQPQYTGDLAGNYYLAGVEVEPKQVTILGNPSILSAVSELMTEVITLDALEDDFTVLAALDLPDGLVAYPGQVLVTFDVEAVQTDTQAEEKENDEITRP
jgi:YbbR domain-containing protein